MLILPGNGVSTSPTTVLGVVSLLTTISFSNEKVISINLLRKHLNPESSFNTNHGLRYAKLSKLGLAFQLKKGVLKKYGIRVNNL